MAAPAFDNPVLNCHAAPATSPVSVALMGAAMTLAKWETRARTRRDLRDLPVDRYSDIGLTTAEVLREVAKPFWRP